MTLENTLTILSLVGLYILGSQCSTSIILILVKYNLIEWWDANMPLIVTPVCLFCLGFWLGLTCIILISYIVGYPINWTLIIPALASAAKTADTLYPS